MKKPLDEMERIIKLRSEAMSFKISMLLMVVWTLYEAYTALTTGERLNILPSLVVTVSCAVQSLCEAVIKRRMIRGDDEYKEPNKALLAAVAVIIIAALVVSVGSFLLLYSK